MHENGKMWQTLINKEINNSSKYSNQHIHIYITAQSDTLTLNPSNFHVIVGGGFPVATHFRETVGPGWSVCSENQYKSSGEASKSYKEKQKKKQIEKLKKIKWNGNLFCLCRVDMLRFSWIFYDVDAIHNIKNNRPDTAYHCLRDRDTE